MTAPRFRPDRLLPRPAVRADEIPTLRCGYCQQVIPADTAAQHWRRGWVSRCYRRLDAA